MRTEDIYCSQARNQNFAEGKLEPKVKILCLKTASIKSVLNKVVELKRITDGGRKARPQLLSDFCNFSFLGEKITF